MSLFNFNQEELLSFFAVLVRFSVLFSVLPFVGDRMIPMPVKILLSLSVSLVLFPVLVSQGAIRPGEAQRWASSAAGIVGTIATEAIFAFVLGYVAKLVFDSISMGGNLVGHFMGFSMASTYDPHQETQTMVVAEVQMTLAMLVFLILDGHHLMLRAALQSYEIVGLGGLKAGFSQGFANLLIQMSGEVFKIGVQLSAPIAIAMFAINIAFGVMAKALPQLNVLVLSLATSALVGMIVLFLTVPEFQGATAGVMSRIGDSMIAVMKVIAKGT